MHLNIYSIYQFNFKKLIAFYFQENGGQVDILWKRKKWLDLLPLAKPKETRIRRAQELVDILKDCQKKQSGVKPSEPQESDAEDLSFGDEEEEFEVAAAPATAAPKGRRVVGGRKYTRKEGQKILDFICENNAFMFTKGVKIFQIMELTQVRKDTSNLI